MKFSTIVKSLRFGLVAIALLFSLHGWAQMPTLSFQPTTNISSSAIYFGTPTARKTQILYVPGMIDTGRIQGVNSIFFKYGINQPNANFTRLDSLEISLASLDTTMFEVVNFTQHRYFTRRTTVARYDSFLIPPGVEGTWFEIPCNFTIFDLNTSRSLLVDIRWKSSSVSTFGVRGQSDFSRRLLAYSANLDDTIGSASSNTYAHIGFANVLPIQKRAVPQLVTISPQPAHNQIIIPEKWHGKPIAIVSAEGKKITTIARAGHTLDIGWLQSGFYMLHCQGQSARLLKTE